ncbi:phosphatase PAP2 family protein [Tabrizicola sp. BL-A-41-H6]|uniref:phosphatase PAP2 family protein n=1 Tax=Tabrizicola sp. BL-A-41-H6 TaxID=3421107 RepID=UPI003D6688C2
MDRIEGWNAALFTALNADATSPQALVLMARVLAETAPYVAVVVLVLLWVRTGRFVRMRLLDATLTAFVGLTVAQVITHIWYHPRPFELGLGHQFMPHAPEASFPSDHATLLFGLALPLLFAKSTRAAALVFAALALGTAWARVYLGVHFPFDMAGGLAVACCAALLVFVLRRPLNAWIYPPVLALYEAVLTSLGLSGRLFPRGK